MIYPKNYENKIGFSEIRRMLRGYCLCTLGCECVNEMTFMTAFDDIKEKLEEIKEFKHLKEVEEELPLQYFYDTRQSVARLRLKGTHMEEQELFELMRTLHTIYDIKKCLKKNEEEEETTLYPTLWM